MFKSISILGSTGSIGTQTLEVCRDFGIKVCALSANSRIDVLEAQAREFKPKFVSVGTKELADELRSKLDIADFNVEILHGGEGLLAVAGEPECECVVSAIVGIAGLVPTMKAIECGKHIALANKETLVTAGTIVMKEIEKRGTMLLPVDSEHSAVFQCLYGNRAEDIEKVILTASGGPFRGRKKEDLQSVTPKEALNHPNWSMGSKITIDSATLMNKGLEVIEASMLFELPPEKIGVLVHPQSIIHSMVEYKDGSVMAQLGLPDMKLPIQTALCYPERMKGSVERLDLARIGTLTFEKADFETFPCLRLAYDALKRGGAMPAALNGANEAAVGLFLEGRIGFTDIPKLIENAMNDYNVNNNPVIDDILLCDREIRLAVAKAAEMEQK